MRKHVVILGAGYGGVSAAKKMAKLAKKKDEVEVTLINKGSSHHLITELHEVAGNRIAPEDLEISLNRLFESTKVNVIDDEINEIDFDNKKLISDEKEYIYDYLILGAGSQPTDCGVNGVDEHALTLWSIKDAEKINQHIENMFQEAQFETDPEIRRELLSFVVNGAGFTGVEMVGELINWFDKLAKKYGIPRKDIDLYLVEGLDRILPNINDKMAAKAADFLRKNNVEIKTGEFVEEVTDNEVVLQNGEIIPARTSIWTCGVKSAPLVEQMDLEKDRSERLIVNDYLQIPEYPEVYAIGDNSAAPWADEKTLPALVETAMQTGECAAKNVVADITGKEKEKIEASLHGVMVSIGNDFAVADVTGLSLKGRPALLLKHMVNMFYFFEIGGIKEGFSLINEYIHEQASHNGLVSQLFDQATRKSHTFFVAILRIFLGYQWIMSGYSKIQDGWLSSPDFLVAGATSSPIGPNAVGWYADLMEAVVMQYPMIFQPIIVFTELAIGLSLFLGFFSVLGALASIFMNINFFLSGTGNMWYLMSSFPCLASSGQVLGLDYYVMPMLKKLIWRKPKNKESHLAEVVKEK